jgi:hypothetical protein
VRQHEFVVIDNTYQYISRAREAPTAVASFFSELNELKTVLLRFYDLSHDINTLAHVDERREAYLLSAMDMDTCKAELEVIQRKIQKRTSAQGPAKMLQMLTWPFEEAGTMRLIGNLHRYV